MSWHAHAGSRFKETGKFRSHAKMGTQKSAVEEYREWHFSLIAHQTGSGVRRICYAVSISDPHHYQVEYLRDFSSIQRAKEAAQEWIDRRIRLLLANQQPGVIGRIPSLPIAPENPNAQEK